MEVTDHPVGTMKKPKSGPARPRAKKAEEEDGYRYTQRFDPEDAQVFNALASLGPMSLNSWVIRACRQAAKADPQFPAVLQGLGIKVWNGVTA